MKNCFIMFAVVSALFVVGCGGESKKSNDTPSADKDTLISDSDNPAADEDLSAPDEDVQLQDPDIVNDVEPDAESDESHDIEPDIEADGDAVSDIDEIVDIDTVVPECEAGDNAPCYEGAPGTEGLGICKAGTKTCGEDGKWGVCGGQTLPSPSELCNGLDDDCNGQTDETFDLFIDDKNCGECNNICTVSEEKHASPKCENKTCGIGACHDGWYDKNGGTDGCEYECKFASPTDDNCDGKDDNCDGQLDEGANFDAVINCGECGNNCEALIPANQKNTAIASCVMQTCAYECMIGWNDIDGNPGCEYFCTKSNNGVEKCDGIDNDCDGIADDGLTCNCTDGSSQICTVGGTFCQGNQTCSNGGWGTCTTPRPDSGAELCDNYDNNCDGKKDEPFMNANQTTYIVKLHCGACNKACQDVNTTSNGCTVNGTCAPSCLNGYFNLDTNNWNGCGIYKSNGKIAGGTSGYDSYGAYADSVFDGTNIASVYTKGSVTLTNLYFKKVSKDGTVVVAEKQLTDVESGKLILYASITYFGGKYHVVYANGDNVFYRPFDMNGNTITGKPAVNLSNVEEGSYAFMPNISKQTASSSIIPAAWYEYSKTLGKHEIHIRRIDGANSSILSGESTISDAAKVKSYIFPVVTNTPTDFGMLYCERNGANSGLYLAVYKNNISSMKNILVESYTGNNACGGYNQYSISTEDGTAATRYFYVAYLDGATKKATAMMRYKWDGTDLTAFGSEKLVVNDASYSQANVGIDVANGNIVVAFTLNYTNTISRLYYQRFNTDFTTNGSIVYTGKNFNFINGFSGRMNTTYAADKSIIMEYYTKPGDFLEMNFSTTTACSN